jgi:5-formyltetrahydrofolate cyclo-ligase
VCEQRRAAVAKDLAIVVHGRDAGKGVIIPPEGLRYHRGMSPASHRADDPLRGAALREAKFALRRRILAARDALAPAVREAAAAAITRGLTALPSFAAARTVVLTASYRSEWGTAALIRAALAAGKTVALPRVDAATRMLELHRVTDPVADVAPGFQDIPEPLAECARVAIASVDWILVPGVAFDHRGRRLGYGGGYYDRLLPLLAPDAVRVAGAYDLQLVDEVPAAPHDLTVDTIVSEARTIAVRSRTG